MIKGTTMLGSIIFWILLAAVITVEIYSIYRRKKNRLVEEKFLSEYVPSVKKIIERQVCDTSKSKIITKLNTKHNGEEAIKYVYHTNSNRFFSVTKSYYCRDIIELVSEDYIIELFKNQPELLLSLGIKLN